MSEHHKAGIEQKRPLFDRRRLFHLEFVDYQRRPLASRLYSLALVITACVLLAFTLFCFSLDLWYGVYSLLVIAPVGMLLVIKALSALQTSRLHAITRSDKPLVNRP